MAASSGPGSSGSSAPPVDPAISSAQARRHVEWDEIEAMTTPADEQPHVREMHARLGSFERYLTALAREAATGGSAAFDTALKTLRAIALNLLKNPGDPKYRELKLSNPKLHERLLQYPASASCLSTLGFEPVSPAAASSAESTVTLTEARESEELTRRAVAMIESTGARGPPSPPSPTAGAGSATGAGAASSDAAAAPTVPRNVLVFSRAAFSATRAESSDLPDADVIVSDRAHEAKLMKDSLRDIRRRRDELNPKFLVSKTRIEAGHSKRTYAVATVHVEFCGESSDAGVVITAHFHPAETVDALFAFVRSCLADPADAFVLFAPPRSILRPSSGPRDKPQTLRQAGLVPAARLVFRAPSGVSQNGDAALRQELLAQAREAVPSAASVSVPQGRTQTGAVPVDQVQKKLALKRGAKPKFMKL